MTPPTARPVALLASDPWGVAKEPLLRLVLRHPRWSTGKRRWAGVALLVPCLIAAFPHLRPAPGAGLVWTWVGGILLWGLDLTRLFVSRERIDGIQGVRSEVWIRPSTTGEGHLRVVVDGRDVGEARSAEVCVFDFTEQTYELRAWRTKHHYSLCLLSERRLYECHRSRDAAQIRRIATELATAVRGDGAAVVEKPVGPVEWRPETPIAAWSAFVPLVAMGLGAELFHRDLEGGAMLLVGVLAICARASVGVQRIARCMGAQTHGYSKRFRGALPARPIPWLTPRRGTLACIGAHAILAAAVLWLWCRR